MALGNASNHGTFQSYDANTRTLANVVTIGNTLVTAGSGNLVFSNTTPINIGVASRTMNIGNPITTFDQGFTGSTYGMSKNGTGNLVLNGSGNYTGGTTLTAGTLIAGNPAAFGASTAPLVISSTLDLATDTSINAYNTTVSASTTILSDKATQGSGGITQALGTLSMSASTLTVAAGPNVTGGSPALSFSSMTLSSTSGSSYFVPTTANLTVAGTVSGSATSGNRDTLVLDGTLSGGSITAAITNGSGGGTGGAHQAEQRRLDPFGRQHLHRRHHAHQRHAEHQLGGSAPVGPAPAPSSSAAAPPSTTPAAAPLRSAPTMR